MATESITVDPDAVTTSSLQALQSSDERRLLDVVDKLRRTGLNGTIKLPQLVVCGDQSSGKSSVLEAITEIPFPRKAGLCTRFATEIVLRRQTTSSVTIKINPSTLRTSVEQAKLAAFSKMITDFSELPNVIEEATTAMGLGKIGESAAFSRDVLSIEISGPDRPQLTLVDLPGLIHSTTKASTAADKDLIVNLVTEYMQNPRTIILAVVSAKNDAANQIILDMIKRMDTEGSRTLGIITKPDYIQSASDQQFWFDLALNKDIFLKRGWHMVRNRTEDEMQFTFQQRNEAERSLFIEDGFKDLPRSSVGIEALRVRLSNLLLGHLTQELPSLRDEMNNKLLMTKKELEALGEKRDTTSEQKAMLTKISMNINQILIAALTGHYVHDFFKSVDVKNHLANDKNVRRFRAVIQDLNSDFAKNMRLQGHKYNITHEKEDADKDKEDPFHGGFAFGDTDNEDEDETPDETPDVEDLDRWLPNPVKMTQDEAMDWVRTMIRGCRGHELPGSVNPEVTSHLFWEQSEPWKEIAEAHIEEIRSSCKEFVNQVIEYAAPAEFKKAMEDIGVNAVLEEALEDGKDELKKLLQDKSRPPSTYNHYYSDTIQKRRQAKYKEFMMKARAKATRIQNSQDMFESVRNQISFDQDVFQDEITKSVERDMETFAAEEALESQRAIYKDKMKYFVTAVTDQVVERSMINSLPERILSPAVVQLMTDEEVAYIAAEPPEVVAQRAFLEERKQMLEKGKEIFREAMGGVKKGRTGR